MSISVDIQLKGFKTLDKQLRALGAKAGGKALRASVGTAVNPVVKEARKRAPKGSTLAHRTFLGRLVAPGFLSRSVAKQTFLSKSKRYASASVGMRREAWYGGLYDRGFTRFAKHKPRRKVRARKWLEKSFVVQRKGMINTLRADLIKNINKAAKA